MVHTCQPSICKAELEDNLSYMLGKFLSATVSLLARHWGEDVGGEETGKANKKQN